jgi:chromosome segregation ATPase
MADHLDQEAYMRDLEEKINELEKRNKSLQESLEGLYEKDDVFMASTRREAEEKENYIKLLQLDIENLTNDKCMLQNNYQTLAGLLSKAHLMSASIEEHVNRRLNRVLQHQQTLQNQAGSGSATLQQQQQQQQTSNSRVGSPKNSAHLSSGESGVAGNFSAFFF